MKSNPTPRRIGILGLVALAGLALAACGRKGDLEPPPGSLPAPEQTDDNRIGTATATDGSAPVRRGRIVPPREPFILDRIL